MKKIIIAIVMGIFLFIPGNIKAEKATVNLYLFYNSTCPHCEAEQKWLKTIEDKYDNLNIIKYEVQSAKNNALMNLVGQSLNEETKSVPYTVIGTNSTVGFGDFTKDQIKIYIEDATKYSTLDVVHETKVKGKSIRSEVIKENKRIENIKVNQTQEEKDAEKEKTSTMTIPLVGKVNVKNFSLPLIAASIGFVDGFNPCAMWVLIFLISMLIGMKNRKRMWIIGLTFLSTSALVYLLIMSAWLKVTLEFSQIQAVKIGIAIVALIGAFINLRSFKKELKKDVGCQVVDDKKRKSIIERVKKFTTQKSIFLALLGVVALAVSVNFVELACSAGLPLLFTQILALNNLNGLEYFFYMGIYMICFLLDDIIIFLIAMFSLKLTGVSNKYNKYSHLIGGLIMLIMGLLMIFKPEWVMMNF